MHAIEYSVFAIIIAATAYNLVQGTWKDVMFLVIAFVVAGIPHILAYTSRITTPAPFRVGLAVFVLATILLGERVEFYERFWWWDLMLHAIAGFGITMIGHVVLALMYREREFRPAPLLLSILAVSLAISLSTLWEIYEFAIDNIFGSNMQPSASDTMWDLTGAATAALVAGYLGWKWHAHTDTDSMIARLLDDSVNRNTNIRHTYFS